MRFLRTAPVVMFVSVALLAVKPVAADVATELETAAKQVVKEAKREKYRSVLITVREGRGVGKDDGAGQFLGDVRERIAEILEADSLKTVVSSDVDELVADLRATQLIRPTEVKDFKDAAEFDGMLVIEARKRGRQRSLRMELLDHLESLWSETIRLPNEGAGSAKRDEQNNNRPSDGFAAIPVRPSSGSQSSAGGGRRGNGPTNSAGGGSNPSAGGGGSGDDGKLADADDVLNNSNVSDLNAGVLRFAMSQLGKQVGNGECWTLANEALKAAGAQPAIGYTFGNRVQLEKIQPGDILQFTSVRIEVGNTYYLVGLPNHTAIVHSTNGNNVTILHQNFGKKIVGSFTFDLTTVKSGTIEAFRPVAAK